MHSGLGSKERDNTVDEQMLNRWTNHTFNNGARPGGTPDSEWPKGEVIDTALESDFVRVDGCGILAI